MAMMVDLIPGDMREQGFPMMNLFGVPGGLVVFAIAYFLLHKHLTTYTIFWSISLSTDFICLAFLVTLLPETMPDSLKKDMDKWDFFPGTYYLKHVDEHGRRSYEHTPRVPVVDADELNHSLAVALANSATTFDRKLSGVPQRRRYHSCTSSSSPSTDGIGNGGLKRPGIPGTAGDIAPALWAGVGRRPFSASAGARPGLRFAASAASRALRLLR